MLFTTTILSLLPLGALATPVLTTRQDATPGAWSVTNLNYGCSPGGCSWGFNVTCDVACNHYAPINTSCHGVETVGKPDGVAQPCDDYSLTSSFSFVTNSTGSYNVLNLIRTYEFGPNHFVETLIQATVQGAKNVSFTAAPYTEVVAVKTEGS